MMPQNNIDAVAFWIVIGIFVVVFGNLIYHSYVAGKMMTYFRDCHAPCCIEEE